MTRISSGRFRNAGSKSAFNDRRKFVEVGHQLYQLRILVNPVAAFFRGGGQFAFDLFLALGRANNNAIGLQALLVVSERSHANGRRTQETDVRESVSAADDPAIGKFQRLSVEQRNHPANRADEPGAREASPGHRLRPVEIVQNARKHIGQNVLRGAAALDLLRG